MGTWWSNNMPEWTDEEQALFEKMDKHPPITVAEAERIFGLIDADKNGLIDKGELMSWGDSALGASFDEEKANGIFAAIDKNNDGELSPEEWVTSLKEMGMIA